MIDKDSILAAIASGGKVNNEEIKLNVNINHVLSFSSGAARIQTSCIRHAKLILSQPDELKALSSLQIRCMLCKRVISYPAWYYKMSFAVNQFHYFICFDSDSPNKPTAKCYRRV